MNTYFLGIEVHALAACLEAVLALLQACTKVISTRMQAVIAAAYSTEGTTGDLTLLELRLLLILLEKIFPIASSSYCSHCCITSQCGGFSCLLHPFSPHGHHLQF